MTAIRLAPAPLLVAQAEDAEDEEERRASAEVDRFRLRALVDEHFDFIWRSLQRMGVPAMDLQDCVQQVFLVASRKLPSIAEGSERSFLIGTAIRVAADARRTVERRREIPEEDTAEPSCPGPQPDEIADQRRLRAMLDDVLAAMPEDLRVVFVLFELEEMPTQDIAALLKLPSGTVASRLRRAREEFDRRVARLKGAATFVKGGKR